MKKYMQTYMLFKEMIAQGQLTKGERMPSIRQAADLYRISRTTVQNAYFQLAAEGYIYAKPQSGYFVSGVSPKSRQAQPVLKNRQALRFDLTGTSADKTSFDFSLWQRYIKSALRQKERLLTYSETQGEQDLRAALADYVRERRNVITSPDRIVIGAGTQALLQILCVLLQTRKTVSFPDSSFTQGSSVFAAHGFEVKTRHKDADIIYVSPSHMSRKGDVMPISRRLELCAYSAQNGSVVIEDDFENDFLYNSTPTPSLYALGKGNIVYMGSFSALLLPGIRISFMVLNQDLSEKYAAIKNCFAQTASKTEQIALCAYLRDGNMKTRTKKIRRLYTQKAKIFCAELQKRLTRETVQIGENGLQVVIRTNKKTDDAEFEKAGIALYTEPGSAPNEQLLITAPSAVPQNELENAARALAAVLQP